MIDGLFASYPQLKRCENEIERAVDVLVSVFRSGKTLLLCGNGGSAADCEHISGELCKGFKSRRALDETKKKEMKRACPAVSDALLEKLQVGLPAIPLPSLTSLSTASANDIGADLTFAQAVCAFAGQGGALMAISTSGNAENVVNAALTAKAFGMDVIALTGSGGGKLAGIADVAIRVPEEETYRVQELHLPVYHAICAEIERRIFTE